MRFFWNRLVRGKAIGAQPSFARDFNTVLEILENIEGAGSICVDKSDPKNWRITLKEMGDPGSGGEFPPAGWSEQTRVTQIQYDSTYHKLQVKTGTVLVKDETEDSTWTDVITFEEFDA